MKKQIYDVTVNTRSNRVDDPPAPPDEEALRKMQMEADAARAEAARVKRELEDIKRQLPNEEQRARWADLEAQAAKAEEERLKKAGEFDGWRTQITEKHSKELEAERQLRENAAAKAAEIERDLQQTLISQQFAQASDLFGPTGKTVFMPEVAQPYFARFVEVVTEASAHGGAPQRRVVVRDHHGAIILDTKTGQPAPFAKAMSELIESHPQKAHLLRGSGKVGANNSGGAHGGQDLDLARLKAADFNDPKVREAVKAQQSNAGGLQVGSAFERMQPKKRG